MNDFHKFGFPGFYIEALKAWYHVKCYTEVVKNDICKVYISDQVIWHNENIVLNKKTLYYAEWFRCGIIYLHDLFENGNFLSVHRILSRLETRRGKQTALFDYAKLRKAIPKVWINSLSGNDALPEHHNTCLAIPKLILGKALVPISEISSRRFYNLIIFKDTFTNKCCLFWRERLETDIDWPSDFNRNLVFVSGNRLREFNFKLLYNLLPERKNLYKWGLADDEYCPHCHMTEYIVHAFMEYDLNKPFYEFLKQVVKLTFNIHFEIDTPYLIKTNTDKELDIVMTIALFSIYKTIINRVTNMAVIHENLN